MTREDKISILELNIRSHKLEDQKEKIQAELEQQETALAGNVKRLEAMRKKSFVARLLRL